MSFELVESNRSVRRPLGGTMASIALHTAIISAAIVATANARTNREFAPPEARVTYIARPDASAGTRVPVKPRPRAVQQPRNPAAAPRIVAPVTVATGIPEILPSAEPAAFPASSGGEAEAGSGIHGSANTETGGPLHAFQVDREVRPLRSNRAPVYPEMLRSRGVEGEVFARFVVNESGRVETKTLEILSTTSPAFESAVRYALERARFEPAEANGRKVVQLVEQRFQFRLDR